MLGIINRKGSISAITKLTVTAGLNWITQMSQNKVMIIIKAIPAENAGIIWYEIDLTSGESGSGFYGFQCIVSSCHLLVKKPMSDFSMNLGCKSRIAYTV